MENANECKLLAWKEMQTITIAIPKLFEPTDTQINKKRANNKNNEQ